MSVQLRTLLPLFIVASIAAEAAIASPKPPPSELGPALGLQAIAMSEHGKIAGYILDGNGTKKGVFLWDRGVFSDLDPQLQQWYWGLGFGMDVNDHGQVVGGTFRLGSFGYPRPLLMDRGQIIDLMGSRSGGGLAAAINDHGQVAGIYGDATMPEQHAFLWDDGRWTDLGPADGIPEAWEQHSDYGIALNDRGEVVGTVGTGSFLWRNGVRTELDFLVTGINNHGLIIGNRVDETTSRAILWEDGIEVDLGTLGGPSSRASAINDKGQIAGMSQTAAGEYHAFRWEDGHMVDLGGGGAGGFLVSIDGINDRGDVTGYQYASVSVLGSYWLWRSGERTPTLLVGNVGSQVPPPFTFIDEFGRVAFNNMDGEYGFDAKIWSDGEIVRLAPATAAASAQTAVNRGREANTAGLAGGHGVTDATGVVTLAIASENPFSAGATLRYTVPRQGRVTIDVVDVRGGRVRGLTDEWQAAGSRVIVWDGADGRGRAVPPGLYFAQLRVGAESRSVKLIRGR